MSELIQARPRTDIRFQLLATVSALSLLTVMASQARAEDADRPTVWIELGAQLDSMGSSSEAFSPGILASRPSMFSPSEPFEHSARHSLGANGEISFQPSGSDWVFSAAVHYGRSSNNTHVHQQTYPDYYVPVRTDVIPQIPKGPRAANFADTVARNSESHTVLDFKVGKDVGLGLFGNKGSSIFNLGVRYAQFATRSNIAIRSIPDFHFGLQYFEYYGYEYKFVNQPYHSNAAALAATRSFHGIGPSLSWKASAPIIGNPDRAEITLDWGLNGALLFGRQKAQGEHHQTKRYYDGIVYPYYSHALETVYKHATPHTRSRSVVVPNIGGFAGFSMNYGSAKVSFGYRADFFFGAVDGGIDTRKTYDRNFHGPFATISIGLGG